MAVGHARGMVVNVDLPRFDATGGWKERPAFIVSTEDFHRNYQRVEKEAGFPDKNGELLLTPRLRSVFAFTNCADYDPPL